MPADVLGCGLGPCDLAADVPVEVLSHADRRGHQLPGFPQEPERPRGGKAPAAPSWAYERHPPTPAGTLAPCPSGTHWETWRLLLLSRNM